MQTSSTITVSFLLIIQNAKISISSTSLIGKTIKQMEKYNQKTALRKTRIHQLSQIKIPNQEHWQNTAPEQSRTHLYSINYCIKKHLNCTSKQNEFPVITCAHVVKVKENSFLWTRNFISTSLLFIETKKKVSSSMTENFPFLQVLENVFLPINHHLGISCAYGKTKGSDWVEDYKYNPTWVPTSQGD